jgi:hypothetical protein
MDTLIGNIKALRAMLSEEGDYSIHRTDGKPMCWGEVMLLGTTMENIDAALEELEQNDETLQKEAAQMDTHTRETIDRMTQAVARQLRHKVEIEGDDPTGLQLLGEYARSLGALKGACESLLLALHHAGLYTPVEWIEEAQEEQAATPASEETIWTFCFCCATNQRHTRVPRGWKCSNCEHIKREIKVPDDPGECFLDDDGRPSERELADQEHEEVQQMANQALEIWMVDTLPSGLIELTAPNGVVLFAESKDTAEMIGEMLIDEANAEEQLDEETDL